MGSYVHDGEASTRPERLSLALHGLRHRLSKQGRVKPFWEDPSASSATRAARRGAAAWDPGAATTAAAAVPVAVTLDGHLLHVQVRGASGLRATGWGGSCNSYCSVSFCGATHRTSVIQHSTQPAWNASLCFDTAPALAAVASGAAEGEQLCLQFEVWHRDSHRAREDFLGQARLRLRHLALSPGSKPQRLGLSLVVRDGVGKPIPGEHGSLSVSVWLEACGAAAAARADSAALPAPRAGPQPPALEPLATNLVLGSGSFSRRRLPAVFSNARGFVYEEPCVVMVKVRLSGVLGLQWLVRGSSSGAAAAAAVDDGKRRSSMWRGGPALIEELPGSGGADAADDGGDAFSGLLAGPRGPALLLRMLRGGQTSPLPEDDSLEEADDLSGGVGRDGGDEDEEEEQQLEQLHSQLDDGTSGTGGTGGSSGSRQAASSPAAPVGVRPLRTASATSSDGGGVVVEEEDEEDEEDEEVDTGLFVYFKVAYGKQRRTSDLHQLPASGNLPLDSMAFVFADVRPLQPAALTVRAYVTRSRAAKGRPLGGFGSQLIDAVHDCEDATSRLAGAGGLASGLSVPRAGAAFFGPAAAAAAAPPEDRRTRPAALAWCDSKGVFALPAVARPLLGKGAAGGALLLHVGVADMDNRAELHHIDLFSDAAEDGSRRRQRERREEDERELAQRRQEEQEEGEKHEQEQGRRRGPVALLAPRLRLATASVQASNGAPPPAGGQPSPRDLASPFASADAQPFTTSSSVHAQAADAAPRAPGAPSGTSKSVRWAAAAAANSGGGDDDSRQEQDVTVQGGGADSTGMATINEEDIKRSSGTTRGAHGEDGRGAAAKAGGTRLLRLLRPADRARGGGGGSATAASGAAPRFAWARGRAKDKGLLRQSSSHMYNFVLKPSQSLNVVPMRGTACVSHLEPPAVLKLQLHQVLPIFVRPGSGAAFPAAAASGSSGRAREGLALAALGERAASLPLGGRRQRSGALPAVTPVVSEGARGPSLGSAAALSASMASSGSAAVMQQLGSLPWFLLARVGRYWIRSDTMGPAECGADLAWTLVLPVYDPCGVVTLAVFGLAGKSADTPVLLGKAQLQLSTHLPGRECRHTLYLPADVPAEEATGLQTLVDTTTGGSGAAGGAPPAESVALAAAIGGQRSASGIAMAAAGAAASQARQQVARALAQSPPSAKNVPFPESTTVRVRDSVTLDSILSDPEEEDDDGGGGGRGGAAPGLRGSRVERLVARAHSGKQRMLGRRPSGAAREAEAAVAAAAQPQAALSRLVSSGAPAEQHPLLSHPGMLADTGVGAVVQVSICLSYKDWGSVKRAYLKSPKPRSFFALGLQKDEDQVAKLEQEVVGSWLATCHPAISANVVEQLTASPRSAFSRARLMAAAQRLLVSMNWVFELSQWWGDLRSWRYPQRNAVVSGILLCLALMPDCTAAALLLWYLSKPVWAALRAGTHQLGLGRVLRVQHSGGQRPPSRERRQLHPRVQAMLSGQTKVPNSTVHELRRRFDQIQSALLKLQNGLDDTAESLERVGLLVRCVDPMASALFALIVLVLAVGFATVGLVPTMSLIALYMVRPPSMRTGAPSSLKLLASNVPRATQR